MTDRDELLRLIEADLDGEIGVDERGRLEAAQRADPTLAAEAAELRRLRGVFRAVSPAAAPSGFKQSVLAATVGADAAATRARSGFRVLRAAPWIAGVAAACLLALMLGPWADDRGGAGSWAGDGSPVETADVPESASRFRAFEKGAARPEAERRQAFELDEELDREIAPDGPRAPAKRARRGATVKELADAGDAAGTPRDATPEAVADALRRADDESSDADATPTAPPVVAPRESTAGATGGPTTGGAVGAGPAGASKDGATPRPTKPAVPVAEAAVPESGQPAEPDLLGGRRKAPAPELTAVYELPASRRYVVFEDEAAARRFVAALDAAAAQHDSKKLAKNGGKSAPGAERGAEDTRSRGSKALDPATGGAGGGAGAGVGGGGGGGRGLHSRSGFADLEAPRVIHRVTFATTDAVVGRTLSRAPQGGVFGESVSGDLLERAEALFKKAESARQAVRAEGAAAERPEAPEEPVAESTSEPEADPGPVADGEAFGGIAGEKSEADSPAADRAGGTARDGDDAEGVGADRPPARIEIVVVVVPRGTLPPRPTAAPPTGEDDNGR